MVSVDVRTQPCVYSGDKPCGDHGLCQESHSGMFFFTSCVSTCINFPPFRIVRFAICLWPNLGGKLKLLINLFNKAEAIPGIGVGSFVWSWHR